MRMLDERFGDLLVTYPVGPGRYLCVCSCSRTLIATVEELREGKKKDCGCGAVAQMVESSRHRQTLIAPPVARVTLHRGQHE